MLLCEPNGKFMRIAKLYKIIDKWRYVIWSVPGARNAGTTTRASSGPYIVYQDQMRFVSKNSDIASTACYGEETITSSIILIKKE